MENKNIDKIISESINNFLLREYYNQLTLPFDYEGDQQMYHDVKGYWVPLKRTYEYFIDWLEEHGRYGKLESKNKDFDKEDLEQGCYSIDTATISDIIDEWEDYETLGDYMEDDIISDFLHMSTQDCFTVPTEEVYKEVEELHYEDDFETWRNALHLTPTGNKLLTEVIKDYVIHSVEYWAYTFKDGLVYVERMITIPNLKGQICQDEMDYFQILNKRFNSNIGECWSYAKEGGYAWNGGDGANVLLKGWIRSEDLDYDNVVFYANWGCKGEEELRLVSGTLVQIDEVIWEDGENPKRLPLKGSIILEIP